MESVAELLGRYSPDKPDEILAIKHFIDKEFRASASVSIRGETIIITVTSASLANMLRLRVKSLRQVANTTKRFSFRIS